MFLTILFFFALQGLVHIITVVILACVWLYCIWVVYSYQAELLGKNVGGVGTV